LWKDEHKIYYQAFSAQGEVFTIGECALLRPSVVGEQPYIGRIESLYQKTDQQKYLVTTWFFWPEETAMGRQPSHGENELFISTEREENLLTAVYAKCFVMTQYQAHQAALSGQTFKKNQYIARMKYDSKNKTLQLLREYKEVPPANKTPTTHQIEKLIGTYKDESNENQGYFVKWRDEKIQHCSWVPKDQIPTTQTPNIDFQNFVPKFPVTIGISAEDDKQTTSEGRRYKTRARHGFSGYGDKWDISNVVGGKDNVQYIPIQRIEKIMIPSWRILDDEEQTKLPPRDQQGRGHGGTTGSREDGMDLEEDSSEEDTRDERYDMLHEEANEFFKKQTLEQNKRNERAERGLIV